MKSIRKKNGVWGVFILANSLLCFLLGGFLLGGFLLKNDVQLPFAKSPDKVYYSMEKSFSSISPGALSYDVTQEIDGETWTGIVHRGNMRVDQLKNEYIYTFSGYLTKVNNEKK